jgi:hypothetical protein
MTYVKVTLKMPAEMYVSPSKSAHYCCPVLTKIGMCCQEISVKLFSIKFNENLFSNSQVGTCGQMVGQTFHI